MEIAIIGGGITGLTTALSLQKVGLKATVYERASELNEIGAGVWIQPNAMKVLHWLGIDQELKSKGHALNKMEICNPDFTAIKEIDPDVVSDKSGHKNTAIHRAVLQQLLFDKFVTQGGVVHLGKDYVSHSQNNESFTINFSDGTAKANIILGADGIKSKVRSTIGFKSDYRHTKQICARAVSNYDLPEEIQHDGKEIWAKRKRFGLSQLSKGKVYFFAVLNEEISPAEITKESLLKEYQEFNPIVHEIIKNTKDYHVGELYDLKRLDSWHRGNVCLMGDAAHATTPNMGQGACQGIEDAYYMAHLLKNNLSDPAKAFQEFTEKRRKKVDYVVNNSWTFGQMAHKPVGQKIMKFIMKLTPLSVMSKQMDKLYEIDQF